MVLLEGGLLKNRGAPLNSIWELGANPVPLTVSVNVVESAATVAGLSEPIAGTGKLTYCWQEPRSSITPINVRVVSFERRLNDLFFPRCVPTHDSNSNPREY